MKDSMIGEEEQKLKPDCSLAEEHTAALWRPALEPNPWAGRAASYTWPHTKPAGVLGHYTGWP